MSKSRIVWMLCAITICRSGSFASSLPILNPDLSAVPILCGGGYAYQAFGGNCGSDPPQQNFNGSPGFGWKFGLVAGNGLTGPNTAFQPPDFTGLPFSQAAFLQDKGSELSQTIGGFDAGGSYLLSFYLGSRYYSGGVDGNQTVEALIDGDVIGTWTLTSFTPFTLEAAAFAVNSGGDHTLEFLGLIAGDHTAFLSGVAIDSTPEPAPLVMIGTGLLLLAGLLSRHSRPESR